VTGFVIGVLVSIVTGAIVNEFCDVSPWLARKTVRRAAALWNTGNRQLAAGYETEWLAVIDDCPGKLTKLFVASRFLAGAFATAERRRLESAAQTMRRALHRLIETDAFPSAVGSLAVSVSSVVMALGVLGWAYATVGGSLIAAAMITAWVAHCSESAAEWAQKSVSQTLSTQWRAAKDAADEREAESALSLEVMGNTYAIVLTPGSSRWEDLEVWHPEQGRFVAFPEMTEMPEMGHRLLRFVSSEADNIIWTLWARHTGFRLTTLNGVVVENEYAAAWDRMV
jgi:hypothetical protein